MTSDLMFGAEVMGDLGCEYAAELFRSIMNTPRRSEQRKSSQTGGNLLGPIFRGGLIVAGVLDTAQCVWDCVCVCSL